MIMREAVRPDRSGYLQQARAIQFGRT